LLLLLKRRPKKPRKPKALRRLRKPSNLWEKVEMERTLEIGS
jgi:hypothetical protein